MDGDACVFCDVISGRGDVTWLARRPGAAAFLPLAEGRLSEAHVLVVSEEHFVGIQDATPEGLHSVALLVQEVARAMASSIDASGVNILNASGKGSDQSVSHLHMHVIPRWRGDGLNTWPTTISEHQVKDDWFDSLRACIETAT